MLNAEQLPKGSTEVAASTSNVEGDNFSLRSSIVDLDRLILQIFTVFFLFHLFFLHFLLWFLFHNYFFFYHRRWLFLLLFCLLLWWSFFLDLRQEYFFLLCFYLSYLVVDLYGSRSKVLLVQVIS